MTPERYTDIPPAGIDVTHLLGRNPTGDRLAAFARYDTAFQLAVYWPDVEHFRACVKAWDAMMQGPADGARDG